ncbi:MAG: hypothetical protein EOO41_04440, partial [Methanobacteriota archaeon]
MRGHRDVSAASASSAAPICIDDEDDVVHAVLSSNHMPAHFAQVIDDEDALGDAVLSGGATPERQAPRQRVALSRSMSTPRAPAATATSSSPAAPARLPPASQANASRSAAACGGLATATTAAAAIVAQIRHRALGGAEWSGAAPPLPRSASLTFLSSSATAAARSTSMSSQASAATSSITSVAARATAMTPSRSQPLTAPGALPAAAVTQLASAHALPLPPPSATPKAKKGVAGAVYAAPAIDSHCASTAPRHAASFSTNGGMAVAGSNGSSATSDAEFVCAFCGDARTWNAHAGSWEFLPRPLHMHTGRHTCRLNVQEWEVVMLIDTREIRSRKDRSYIHAQLLTRNIACEVRALPLGDFMWIVRRKRVASHFVPGDKRLAPGAGAAEVEYVCGFIVERKEVGDLAASLVDGRYT